MAHEAGTAGGRSPEGRSVDVWMIVAIVAIAVALIAGYLAFTYKGEVDDWEAAATETVAALQAAGVELQGTIESGVTGYEQQISDLSAALEEAQTAAGIASSGQEETQAELADTQAQLADTQADLEETQQQLEATQAELDDAEATLEQLGELVLPDGTYVGPILGARTDPIEAIIFQDDAAWRVAQVAPEVSISVGEQTLTFEELSDLLVSTEPAAVVVANGNFEVTVEGGVVTSMTAVEG